jgi:S-disulfanyl-L-cysteine oxidoreductase SoxD
MNPATRNKIGLGLFAVAIVLLAISIIAAVSLNNGNQGKADPENAQQVARGQAIYAQYCTACHGAQLEGQPEWRTRLASGRLPAPPHDASGHTWHHPDSVLFGITKHGLVPGKYAPPGYQSDMPAFGNTLSDEDIWAVLAYIKTSWPKEIRGMQHNHSDKSRSDR